MKKMHVFNEFAVFVLTLCFSVCAIIFSRRGWLNGFMPTINKTFYLMPALQMGIIYRQYENFFCRRKALSIGAIMALIFIINAAVGKPYDINMLSGRFIGNPAHIISWSLLCVLLTVIICEALAPAFRENKIVKAIGENSFSPMMHHMAVITLINAGIYVLSRFISMDFKADKWFSSIVYVYPWRNGNITFFYTILCIAVPVLIKIGVDKLVLRLNARLSRAE